MTGQLTGYELQLSPDTSQRPPDSEMLKCSIIHAMFITYTIISERRSTKLLINTTRLFHISLHRPLCMSAADEPQTTFPLLSMIQLTFMLLGEKSATYNNHAQLNNQPNLENPSWREISS